MSKPMLNRHALNLNGKKSYLCFQPIAKQVDATKDQLFFFSNSVLEYEEVDTLPAGWHTPLSCFPPDCVFHIGCLNRGLIVT